MINCTKCEKEKEESEFRSRTSSKTGYQYWCKQCENEANKARYTSKPKKEKESKEIDKEEIAAKAKGRMLLHRYNLTQEDYYRMYEEQNRQCAICEEELELGGRKGLYVDHCHSSGKVRGLLCPSCNSAIGKLKDDIGLFNKAIDYILKHQI